MSGWVISLLLLSKSLHRIDARGAPGREIARDQRDTSKKREHTTVGLRIGRRDAVEYTAHRHGDSDTQHGADGKADQCKSGAFLHHRSRHGARGGPERETNAELAYAPPHVEGDDGVLSDSSDQQRNARKNHQHLWQEPSARVLLIEPRLQGLPVIEPHAWIDVAQDRRDCGRGRSEISGKAKQENARSPDAL